MKRAILILLLLSFALLPFGLWGCGGSSSSGSGSSSSDPDAADYATFGQELSDVIPAGLKVGGANADIAASSAKELSGSCAAAYQDCPAITASGGGDSAAGEILMRLWGLDYNDDCTNTLLAGGSCFDCVDCQTGSVGTTLFIRPTMLANPSACASTSTTDGKYVNLGVDPCFFDAMIGQISNIAECETVAGGAVDISSAVPWYSSWGLSQTVNFSSYYSRSSGGGIWWTVNSGPAGNMQHFLSLDSNWLYAGIKDSANDRFIFLGSGSPAYYAGRGEGSGVNVSVYAGTLSAIPASFEAMQIRVQEPDTYIERLKSNGSHLWYQSWSGGDFPSASADVEAVRDSPSMNRCVEIGASIVASRYVPLADCVASFSAADVADLNRDEGFTLKIVDGQTASSIDFSTALTPTTSTSCLPASQEAGQ